MADIVDIKAERDKLIQKAKEDNYVEDLTEDLPTSSSYPSRELAEQSVPDLKEMNERYAFVHNIGGKPAIKCNIYDEYLGREKIDFITPDSLLVTYGNRLAEESKMWKKGGITLGKWWLTHPHRKDYITITFEPKRPPGEYHVIDPIKVQRNKIREQNKEDPEDVNVTYYNMWEGFGVTPKKGSWKKIRKHIYKVLCNSNKEKFKYVIRWMAWAVQNPGDRAGVALIFKGKKGSGKGTILTALAKMFGRHGLIISDRQRLTGKHNDHLSTCSLLFADEAYNPGDKEAEGILKSLITEESLTTEPKFKALKTSRNCLHIVMATNADWIIPATEDERRYFINETTNIYAQGQNDPLIIREHFKGLNQEIYNQNGLAAWLYALLNIDLKDWNPRNDIPRTEEMLKQMAMSMPKLKYAFSSMLDDGIFPGSQDKILDGSLRYVISATNLLEHLQRLDINNKSLTSKALAKLCEDLGLERVRTNKNRQYVFHELGEMRRIWNEKISKNTTWRLNEEWDVTNQY